MIMCRKAVNEVKVTSTTEHLETLKMECGDGRITDVVCSALACNEVSSVIFLL